jgi:hypothetical protein
VKRKLWLIAMAAVVSGFAWPSRAIASAAAPKLAGCVSKQCKYVFPHDEDGCNEFCTVCAIPEAGGVDPYCGPADDS